VAGTLVPPFNLGLELNFYLSDRAQVGLVAGGDSVFVAGHVYAALHYTRFLGNSFFVRPLAGLWAGTWGGEGSEVLGPSALVVLGHEWMGETGWTYGLEYGGLGVVFDVQDGFTRSKSPLNPAFTFPHFRLGKAW